MHPRLSRSNPHHQKGIATILLVVLVGIALTASSIGYVSSLKNAQDKQVAIHATTHAQNGAWLGVEAFRGYLAQLQSSQVANLPNALAIDFQGNYGALSVNNISVTPDGDNFKVSADIVNLHASARSGVTVGAVYELKFNPPPCVDCVVLETALDFHDDLDIGGDITFVPLPDSINRINVDGDVSILSVNLNNVDEIFATGSVTLNSAVNIQSIFSNDDVTLGGGSWADTVHTRGNVTTADGAGIGSIWANGDVTLGGSRRSDTVNSLGNVAVTASATHGLFRIAGNFDISGLNTTVIEDLRAVGDVNINTTEDITLSSVISEGSLYCATPDWNNFDSISLNGSLGPNCTSEATDLAKVTTGANNTIDLMNEVQPISIPRFVVDVWTLKRDANYVFEWDVDANATKVTIQNINGIADGEYYIGDYSGPQKSYICENVDGSGSCTSPVAPKAAICLGHSTWNSCLSYDEASQKWTFNGTSVAPGIMWFDGNVMLDNGYNYATILATGNVETGGQFRGVSVNYGAYDEICTVAGTNISNATYRALFATQYPTNLCNRSTREYTPINTGNIGIAAGGYNPEAGGNYSGGNISLGTNNQVWGAVLAGGYLHTHGQTVVNGYVTAAVSGNKGAEENTLGGNTTIDLTHGNDTYNPAVVPDMTGGACPDCDGLVEHSLTPESTDLLWSRYR